MRLLNLSLKNFKGIKSFTLDTQGEDVNIYGDNATGKTTIFDAFTWLLFDKDSQNKKDFEIKTLDSDGQPIHGLDHEVEATLELNNGKTLTLKKIYREKWTKKRGSATAEFTGHTVDHFIDGVPVKKGEYEAKIADIVDENVFKLLTNPKYFNEQLHWKDRRKILLEVCGDVSDGEVIASDSSLSRLPEILGNRSLEDHRKVIQARRAEINKELEKIPVRIDEVQRSLPNTNEADLKAISSEISAFRARERDLLEQLTQAESGGAVAEKTKLLRKLEGELLELKNQHRSRFEIDIQEKQKLLSQAKDKYNDLLVALRGMEKLVELRKEEITSLNSRLVQLRAKWHEVNDKQFEFEQSDTCPTCGQKLPVEKLEAARNKALAQFNQEKAEKLESISTEGKQLKAKVVELETEVAELEKKIADTRTQIGKAEFAVDAYSKEVEFLRSEQSNYDASPACVSKLKEIEELEAQIGQLKAGSQEVIDELKEQLNDVREEIAEREQLINQIHAREQGLKRIEELKAQERQLAAEYEELERQLYLTEQFIRTKVNLLEEKINSRFKLARFKLFDVQVNGALVETCETLYKGVPYSSLNNAARINIGLDIINTLAEHYNFTAPIFIDNAEAVTELIKTKGQMIKLIVSEPDKFLRVEHTEKTKMKEAV